MGHGVVQGDIHVQHLSVLRLPPSPGGRWDLHGAGGGAGLCPRKRGTAPGPGRLSSPATPSAENRKLAGNAAHLWGTRPGATTCPQPSLWPCVPHLQRAAAPCWQGSRAPAAPACGHRTRHSPPPGLAPGPRGCRRRGGRAHRAACSRPPLPLPGRALPAVWSLSRWRPSVQTLARGWRPAHLRVLWLLGALGSGLGACPLTRGREGLAAPASDAGPRHFRPLCPALP